MPPAVRCAHVGAPVVVYSDRSPPNVSPGPVRTSRPMRKDPMEMPVIFCGGGGVHDTDRPSHGGFQGLVFSRGSWGSGLSGLRGFVSRYPYLLTLPSHPSHGVP